MKLALIQEASRQLDGSCAILAMLHLIDRHLACMSTPCDEGLVVVLPRHLPSVTL